MRNYIEVSLKTGIDSGELIAAIEDPAFLGAYEKDGIVYLYWPEQSWTPQSEERLRSALRDLAGGADEIEMTTSLVPDQDWNSVWTKSIEPIRIGRRVLIRQSWNSSAPFPEMIELVIDPKRAFGTGFHATTQLVIEWLEDRIQGGERILDCGTGSGILAMVALRLGAQTVLGIDNDPIAIECAREYAAFNGFGSQLDLRVSAIVELAPEKFDLVLANLDRNTLLRHCRALVEHARPGGALLVTGICAEDCDEIVSAFSGLGCGLGEKRERAGWLALELLR